MRRRLLFGPALGMVQPFLHHFSGEVVNKISRVVAIVNAKLGDSRRIQESNLQYRWMVVYKYGDVFGSLAGVIASSAAGKAKLRADILGAQSVE